VTSLVALDNRTAPTLFPKPQQEIQNPQFPRKNNTAGGRAAPPLQKKAYSPEQADAHFPLENDLRYSTTNIANVPAAKRMRAINLNYKQIGGGSQEGPHSLLFEYLSRQGSNGKGTFTDLKLHDCHLLSHHLGGKRTPENLVPAPETTNAAMLGFENAVLAMLDHKTDKNHRIVDYEVAANYGRSGVPPYSALPTSFDMRVVEKMVNDEEKVVDDPDGVVYAQNVAVATGPGFGHHTPGHQEEEKPFPETAEDEEEDEAILDNRLLRTQFAPLRWIDNQVTKGVDTGPGDRLHYWRPQVNLLSDNYVDNRFRRVAPAAPRPDGGDVESKDNGPKTALASSSAPYAPRTGTRLKVGRKLPDPLPTAADSLPREVEGISNKQSDENSNESFAPKTKKAKPKQSIPASSLLDVDWDVNASSSSSSSSAAAKPKKTPSMRRPPLGRGGFVPPRSTAASAPIAAVPSMPQVRLGPPPAANNATKLTEIYSLLNEERYAPLEVKDLINTFVDDLGEARSRSSNIDRLASELTDFANSVSLNDLPDFESWDAGVRKALKQLKTALGV
jgi:hypothetical protein